LASVIDIGPRRLLGYSMADHRRTELVLDAAITARAGHIAGVIAHADRGSRYTSNDYLDFCNDTSSDPLPVGWRRVSTTPWPSRSGHH
jgi:transposase InsO family protein